MPDLDLFALAELVKYFYYHKKKHLSAAENLVVDEGSEKLQSAIGLMIARIQVFH